MLSNYYHFFNYSLKGVNSALQPPVSLHLTIMMVKRCRHAVMSRGGGARHSQTLPGKPHHDRILCLLATLSSVIQLCETAIVNRRFNHNHRTPVKQTIASFNGDCKKAAE